ncbi:phosphatidylglycerophosphatase A [Aestuariivirga sp.]|uniref:phosphatidylglycerophosphatase A family protein n=1 Tax=Aestuariivirga sp. TaxID=2650926 RepID=UPI0039E63205
MTQATPPRATLAHLRYPACLVALGFGAGLSPVWPGTVGAALAFPLFLFMQSWSPAASTTVLTVLAMIGTIACGRACRILGAQDHPQVVWDETVGQLLVLLAVPESWPWWLAAFIAFRVFDIVKPWPVRLADVYATGGAAVMLDDCIAAFQSIMLLRLIHGFTG